MSSEENNWNTLGKYLNGIIGIFSIIMIIESLINGKLFNTLFFVFLLYTCYVGLKRCGL